MKKITKVQTRVIQPFRNPLLELRNEIGTTKYNNKYMMSRTIHAYINRDSCLDIPKRLRMGPTIEAVKVASDAFSHENCSNTVAIILFYSFFITLTNLVFHIGSYG